MSKPFVEDCIAFLQADGSLDTHDALTLARKLTSDRAKRMAESLERMVKSEEECEAADEAERNADVDAQDRPGQMSGMGRGVADVESVW